MTAEKLRKIAQLMDLFDTILGKVQAEGLPDLTAKLRALVGSEVQTDLRNWALDLEKQDALDEFEREDES